MKLKLDSEILKYSSGVSDVHQRNVYRHIILSSPKNEHFHHLLDPRDFSNLYNFLQFNSLTNVEPH